MKYHIIKCSEIALHYVQAQKNCNGHLWKNMYALSSEVYDEFLDKLILISFVQKDIHEMVVEKIHAWFLREGKEIYTYGTLDELEKICSKFNLKRLREFDDIRVRDYYTRYLQFVTSNDNIFDAKQITIFQKIC